ncbi:MAG: aldehyde dehydrogenase (NADP(+)) [Ferruginibacter sp.]|nr:aldehyde dehydrogenase (NADP(+)) [Cytophagales bacterium]
MQLTGSQLIGNQLSKQGSKTFTGFRADSGEALPTVFHEATAEEVDGAVELANEAFETYRKKSGAEKAVFLERIAEEILALGDELIGTASEETALPAARLTGERGRTVNQLKLFAQVVREGSWVNARIDTAVPDRQPAPKPDLRQMLIPLGTVGVFGASNFPFAFSVAGGDTVSALAAGCPVVFKGHPAHPATSELVGRAIGQAVRATGMPEGVFSLVHGASTDVGMRLVGHPLVKAIGFTGSYRGGKALFDAAGQRPEPIPVYAEMSSTNPVFFLPRILKERGDLATALAGSVTLGVGQFCTNPGVFVVDQSEEATQFIHRTAAALNAIMPAPMLTAGIRRAYLAGIRAQQTVAGTASLTDFSEEMVKTHLLQTTVGNALQHPHLTDEVFGPSTVGVVADNPADRLRFARSLPGHLTATVWGTDQDLAENVELIEVLKQKVGRLLINDFPTGVEVTYAMTHGGPFPATTDSRTTSVGTLAIERFCRPISFQNFPPFLLPDELKEENPLKISRLVNGKRQS